MGLSTLLLIVAVGAAGAGVVAGAVVRPWPLAMVAALAASGAATLVGVVAVRLFSQVLGFFGLVHALYLAAVVTVPLIAATGLVAGRWARSDLTGPIPRLMLAAGLVPAALGYYATHVEPNRLVTDRQVVTVDHDADLRVGVMADLQTPNVGAHERRAVERLLDAELDLLLVPGDLHQFEGHDWERRWPEFRDLVAELAAGIEHVVVVEGDTDFVAGLDVILEGTGAVLLVDEVLDLDVDGRPVAIAGLTLSGHRTRAGQDAIGELAARPTDTTTILLSHRPDAVFEVVPGSIDLVVSGHTHGGQIAVPLIGPLVTATDVPRAVAAGGLHQVDGREIYVSTGVGLERGRAPQVRFLVRPSIGVLEISGPGPDLSVSDP